MLDAFQDHCLGDAVDPADCTPVAMSHPDPMLMAAKRPSGGMWRERVGGKDLNADKKHPPVARWQCREIFDGARRNDQPQAHIIRGVLGKINRDCR